MTGAGRSGLPGSRKPERAAGVRGHIGDLWPNRLRRRHDPTSGLADLEAALTHDECPVCARTARVDERWMDHFLYEGYQEPEMMAAVARGAGFCAWHARRLEGSGAASTIAWIYLYAILHKLPRRLADGPRRSGARRELIPDPGYCVTCDHARDAERRECFFLSLLLKERGLECYRRPAMVCMPHLLRLVDFLDPRQTGRIVDIHSQAVADLRSMLSDRGATPLDPVTDPAADRAIRQILGPPSRGSALPPDGADDVFQAQCDPVARLRSRLGASLGCSVCAEIARSCGDWLGWLAGAADGSQDLSDVLPLCRHHVWQACSEQSPALARLLAGAAASEADARLAYARRAFNIPPGGPKIIPEHVRRRWVGRRRRSDALRSLRRARECPLCRRAREACERTILLLAALLDERPGRRAFECGYGLCVAHASRALRLLGDRAAGRVIAQTISARLGVLRWELEEQVRRGSWGTRPEDHGAEGGAWRRATLRFSGTVCEDGP